MKNYIAWIVSILAGVVCIAFMAYINVITSDMRSEEEQSMQLWAEATQCIVTAEDAASLDLAFKIIKQNSKIPVIVTEGTDSVTLLRNIDGCDTIKSQAWAQEHLQKMLDDGVQFIDIKVDSTVVQRLYYGHSNVIDRLNVFSWFQVAVVLVFVLIIYMTFRAKRKSEQDKLLIGLARETAHQLGTPISALIGWTDMLRAGEITNETASQEIGRDVSRLHDVAERFSKIGSAPKLERRPICEAIEASVEYLRPRIPKNVKIDIECVDETLQPPHNPTLIGWAVENICRNSVDALPNGSGSINISLTTDNKYTYITIKDDGKGMSQSIAKHIFDAGYTTKTRGWGIGLTLTRRIVREYHKGDIYVLSTELGKGTTIVIKLRN
ncbi:MAG: HAMP domain-containing histidine kinase [Bacteroidales bacterium]|jgi:signal transduction histidine kinase|nr:HAMP domain-containing histidine kinase [Bacteroidales bacterium]